VHNLIIIINKPFTGSVISLPGLAGRDPARSDQRSVILIYLAKYNKKYLIHIPVTLRTGKLLPCLSDITGMDKLK
jgi:hypothetical protein